MVYRQFSKTFIKFKVGCFQAIVVLGIFLVIGNMCLILSARVSYNKNDQTEALKTNEGELIKRTTGDKISQGFADEQIPLFDSQNRLAGYKYHALLDTDEFLIPNTSDLKKCN
ncbi:hypothetical protein MAR_020283 [Mya arenaria]|uniref:Uncharacterized protein n=1 Tax=Mya arenaria TaxID=6604 RepID=A0ABY7E6Y0_MYAAR|nr:hypothetical protein MAR_020283 [Mya arenaria]